MAESPKIRLTQTCAHVLNVDLDRHVWKAGGEWKGKERKEDETEEEGRESPITRADSKFFVANEHAVVCAHLHEFEVANHEGGPHTHYIQGRHQALFSQLKKLAAAAQGQFEKKGVCS